MDAYLIHKKLPIFNVHIWMSLDMYTYISPPNNILHKRKIAFSFGQVATLEFIWSLSETAKEGSSYVSFRAITAVFTAFQDPRSPPWVGYHLTIVRIRKRQGRQFEAPIQPLFPFLLPTDYSNEPSCFSSSLEVNVERLLWVWGFSIGFASQV